MSGWVTLATGIVSIAALLISILTLFFTPDYIRLFVEHLTSDKYILLKLKKDHENNLKHYTNVYPYISKKYFWGVNSTDWYYLDISKEQLQIFNNETLRGEGYPWKGIKFQEDFEIILRTRKCKRDLKQFMKQSQYKNKRGESVYLIDGMNSKLFYTICKKRDSYYSQRSEKEGACEQFEISSNIGKKIINKVKKTKKEKIAYGYNIHIPHEMDRHSILGPCIGYETQKRGKTYGGVYRVAENDYKKLLELIKPSLSEDMNQDGH